MREALRPASQKWRGPIRYNPRGTKLIQTMTMRIAVLGGGHGAYAAAADLAEQGHEIRLWRRDAKALAPLIESSAITLKDSRGQALM